MQKFLLARDEIKSALELQLKSLFFHNLKSVKVDIPETKSPECLSVEVQLDLFLVSPNRQKTSGAQVQLVTTANCSTLVTRWKNSRLFDFESLYQEGGNLLSCTLPKYYFNNTIQSCNLPKICLKFGCYSKRVVSLFSWYSLENTLENMPTPVFNKVFLYGVPYTKLSIEDHMHNFIEDGGGHIFSITTHRGYSITQYTCGVLFP